MSENAENIVPFLRHNARVLNILTVEDDRTERMFMEQKISDLGHTPIQAVNGQEAIDMLRSGQHTIDIVLMDRMMPVMDGISAVRLMKDDPLLKSIPIVMVTGASSPTDIQEGIDAGVFYYLTKPFSLAVLKSILSAATREIDQIKTLNEELNKHRTSFNLVHTCKFVFRTIEEAEALSGFIAQCFPDPARVLPGLGELLFNAIEHGTYEIGYDRKSDLIDSGTMRAELQRRQTLTEYKDRSVEALVTRKDDAVYVVITDQGPGFPWKKYLTIEPSRASDNHGRGIAQANALSFDRLTFNEKGNQVIGYVNMNSHIEW
jgi:two-component system cell cycle response regulator